MTFLRRSHLKRQRTFFLNILPHDILTFLLLSAFLGVLPAHILAAPDTVELTQRYLYAYANIETIGVVVNGVDLPQTAELLYRQRGQGDWNTGQRQLMALICLLMQQPAIFHFGEHDQHPDRPSPINGEVC